jgi:tRNA(Ile)-lysidine synthase
VVRFPEGRILRPLLKTTRADIEAYLRALGQDWREDSSNRHLTFTRNRIRHEILPLLREGFNPRLDEALANLATLAQDEELYWQSEIERLQAPASRPLTLRTSELAALPRALARRLIRRTLELAKGDLRQIEFAHIERILEMATCSEGHDRVQIPGLDVFRSFEWIRFVRPEEAGGPERDFSIRLQVPGSVELPGGCARITLQMLEKPDRSGSCVTVVNELDLDRLRAFSGAVPTLELRNWRPGDKYRPAGRCQEEKIKLLFQEGRVPLWERRNWPIITYNGIILWTRRFGAAADFAASPGARVVLKVEESG